MSYNKIFGHSDKMKMTEAQHPGTIFRNFSITASPTVCRFCRFGAQCYTAYGRMSMDTARQAYNENLEMARTGALWERMEPELASLEKKAAREGKQVRIRVHDSGDYYSREYLFSWLETARNHPSIIFYSYTKAVGWVKQAQDAGEVPENFRFVFSIGTTQALQLTESDRVAGVFGKERAVPPGWMDGSHDDFWVSEPTGNIFLRYHGPKSKAFEALPPWMVDA